MQALQDERDGCGFDGYEGGRGPGPQASSSDGRRKHGTIHEPSRLPDVIRLTRLAESFRCLEYKPGVRPWNAAELAAWVESGDATVAKAQAAAFVLEVANMTVLWEGVPAFRADP